MILLTNLILPSLITLAVIGLTASVVLYFVARKFKVEEDPRIEQVESNLPGANCGGCGFPGCHGFADACVKADTLEGKLCPVGGQPVMQKIAAVLGREVAASEPKIAVVRCNGTCSNRPQTTSFDGAKSCRVLTQLYAGQTACSFGCLGLGDCVDACQFNAIKIDPATGLVRVDEELCTGCGACVKACPKNVIELRNKGKKGMRVFVSCVNKDKGGVARKACSAACIGCGKCSKACPFDAITVENNLAYIDFEKCRSCRKCVAECPTGAIHDVNFPKPVDRTPKPAPAKPAPAQPAAVKQEPTAPAAQPQEEKAAQPAPQVPVVETKKEAVEVEIISVDAPAEQPKEATEQPPTEATPAQKVEEVNEEPAPPAETKQAAATAVAPEEGQSAAGIPDPAADIDPALRVKPRTTEQRSKKTVNEQPTLF